MLFWGGSSDPSCAQVTKHVMRPVLDAHGDETGEYREVAVKAKRNPGQSEQFARLMLGRRLLRMKRKQSIQSEATSAHRSLEAQARADARALVKTDIDSKLAVFASSAAPYRSIRPFIEKLPLVLPPCSFLLLWCLVLYLF
eukprot:4164681-Pleurochrysis_carterae.AAC.5